MDVGPRVLPGGVENVDLVARACSEDIRSGPNGRSQTDGLLARLEPPVAGTLEKIRTLRQVYDLDLEAADSHQLVESAPAAPAKGRASRKRSRRSR